MVVPKDVNSLGVSMICELNEDDDKTQKVLGYNANGEFKISSFDENADITIGALNQQEGTVTCVDKRVLPINVALEFQGVCLNDIASSLGISKRYTIDYTKELGQIECYKEIEFDSLENYIDNFGNDERGYKLENTKVKVDYKLDDIDELPEFNGTVVYHSNPVLQFNSYTAKAKELPKDNFLFGSSQFAIAAKIKDGDKIKIGLKGKSIERIFKVDDKLKGTIAINPTFDIDLETNRYRLEKSKIERVES